MRQYSSIYKMDESNDRLLKKLMTRLPTTENLKKFCKDSPPLPVSKVEPLSEVAPESEELDELHLDPVILHTYSEVPSPNRVEEDPLSIDAKAPQINTSGTDYQVNEPDTPSVTDTPIVPTTPIVPDPVVPDTPTEPDTPLVPQLSIVTHTSIEDTLILPDLPIVRHTPVLPIKTDTPIETDILTDTDIPIEMDIPTEINMPIEMDIPTGIDIPIETNEQFLADVPRATDIITDLPVVTDIPVTVAEKLNINSFEQQNIKEQNTPTTTDTRTRKIVSSERINKTKESEIPSIIETRKRKRDSNADKVIQPEKPVATDTKKIKTDLSDDQRPAERETSVESDTRRRKKDSSERDSRNVEREISVESDTRRRKKDSSERDREVPTPVASNMRTRKQNSSERDNRVGEREISVESDTRKRKKDSSEGDNGVIEPGTSGSDVRTRKRDSSGREQDRDTRSIEILIQNLSKHLLAEKPRNNPRDNRQFPSYVTREKYLRLMTKYNDLQADYAKLQNNLKLALKMLEVATPRSESEDEDEQDDTNETQEIETQQNIEPSHIHPSDDSSTSSNNTPANTGNTETDRAHLARSKHVRQFIQRAVRVLFDQETLLVSTVTGKPGNRFKYSPKAPDYNYEPKMLDRNKIDTIRVWLDEYLDEKKFNEKEKNEERNGLLKQISIYLSYLKKKHREGVDISNL